MICRGRTIRERQTCFCGLLRSVTTASRRTRSAGLTFKVTPMRIPQSRTAERVPKGLFRQVAAWAPADASILTAPHVCDALFGQSSPRAYAHHHGSVGRAVNRDLRWSCPCATSKQFGCNLHESVTSPILGIGLWTVPGLSDLWLCCCRNSPSVAFAPLCPAREADRL
jgi:hypothetical protein